MMREIQDSDSRTEQALAFSTSLESPFESNSHNRSDHACNVIGFGANTNQHWERLDK